MLVDKYVVVIYLIENKKGNIQHFFNLKWLTFSIKSQILFEQCEHDIILSHNAILFCVAQTCIRKGQGVWDYKGAWLE